MRITIPDGMSVEQWGKTRIDMKKFAKLLCHARAMSP